RVRHRLEQRMHEQPIDHGCFVNDEQVAVEGVLAIPPKTTSPGIHLEHLYESGFAPRWYALRADINESALHSRGENWFRAGRPPAKKSWRARPDRPCPLWRQPEKMARTYLKIV